MADPNSCPFHNDVKHDIERLEEAQRGRKCDDHTVRLNTLEQSETSQWKDIKALQKLVWTGVGLVMAAGFLGSIIGSMIMRLIWK